MIPSTMRRLDVIDYLAIAADVLAIPSDEDGNERSAWLAMRLFLAMNDLAFSVPSADEVEQVVTSLAGRQLTEAEFVAWVRVQAS